jgi:hypothetical protein
VGKNEYHEQEAILTLTYPEAIASLTAAAISIRSGMVSCDPAEALIVEISGLISFGQMFDSSQGPVLFLTRIRRQESLQVKQPLF